MRFSEQVHDNQESFKEAWHSGGKRSYLLPSTHHQGAVGEVQGRASNDSSFEVILLQVHPKERQETKVPARPHGRMVLSIQLGIQIESGEMQKILIFAILVAHQKIMQKIR